MKSARIGIIGGSGFYQFGLTDAEYVRLRTPFGQPSEKLLLGSLQGHDVAFLSRHGLDHRLNPAEVNYRANLYALKKLGVEFLISVTAVGSLKEELRPTDLVIPDQFYDQSYKREKTFFEKGVVAHVSMAEPTCPYLRGLAFDLAGRLGIAAHNGGTYFNMEGPQFSSKGESLVYRQLGFAVIGMTMAVEAKLARELEMCFLPLALVTDYDCWHESNEAVTVEQVLENMKKCDRNAMELIKRVVADLEGSRQHCSCSSALATAVITAAAAIPQEAYRRLELIIGKYLKKNS